MSLGCNQKKNVSWTTNHVNKILDDLCKNEVTFVWMKLYFLFCDYFKPNKPKNLNMTRLTLFSFHITYVIISFFVCVSLECTTIDCTCWDHNSRSKFLFFFKCFLLHDDEYIMSCLDKQPN